MHNALQRRSDQPVINYDHDSHAFYYGTKVLPGLTKQIEDLFCHPNFHRMSLNGIRSKHSDTQGQSGPSLGNRIDRELKMWAEDFGKTVKQMAMGWNGVGSLTNLHATWHPYTKALAKFFTEVQRWAPVRGQVAVGDPCGVATKIDMVFEDAKGQIHLVEIKSGYNQSFKGNWPVSERQNKPEKWLTDDLHDERADTLTLALIEIYWGELLWAKNYATQPAGSYVVHVHDGDYGAEAEVDIYGVQPWMNKAIQRILAYHQHLQEKQMKRKHQTNISNYEKEQRKEARDKAREVKAKEKELKKQLRELKTKAVREKHAKETESKLLNKELTTITDSLEELKRDLEGYKQAAKKKPNSSSSSSFSSSSYLPPSLLHAIKEKRQKRSSSARGKKATRTKRVSQKRKKPSTFSSSSTTKKPRSSSRGRRTKKETLLDHGFQNPVVVIPAQGFLTSNPNPYAPRQNIIGGAGVARVNYGIEPMFHV